MSLVCKKLGATAPNVFNNAEVITVSRGSVELEDNTSSS